MNHLFRILLLSLLISGSSVALWTNNAQAQKADFSQASVSSESTNALDRKFGIGLEVGSLTALNFQARLDQNNALDFAFGGGWWRGRHIHLHAQYLHYFDIEEWDAGALRWHVGGGLQYNVVRYGWYFNDYITRGASHWLGIAAAGGVSFSFRNAPFDVMTEFRPGIFIIQDVGFLWTWNVGGRYWF